MASARCAWCAPMSLEPNHQSTLEKQLETLHYSPRPNILTNSAYGPNEGLRAQILPKKRGWPWSLVAEAKA